MKDFFKRLKLRHWAWIHVLAAAGIWWPLHIIFTTPEFLSRNVDDFVLHICMWTAVFGAVVKITGFAMSQQPGKTGVLGVSVELAGLILASIGPVAYLGAYGYLLITGADLNFSSAFIFAYAMCAVYLYRAIILVPRFRREAHDPAKE